MITSLGLREFLAEFLGTFVLTMLGCCTNAAVNVSGTPQLGPLVGPWGWGLGLGLGIYSCAGVSGGHINPAVTVGMATVGKLPWNKVPHYLAGQYLGAFVGAVGAFAVYREPLNKAYNGMRIVNGTGASAGIFGTFSDLSAGSAFLDVMFGSFFLLLLINAITDARNMEVAKGLIPLIIGVASVVILFALGSNAGGPLNVARDLSPRIFTALAGWGGGVFSYNNYYFWIPIVGCHLGGIAGCWAYLAFIEMHWPPMVMVLDKPIVMSPQEEAMMAQGGMGVPVAGQMTV